MRPLLLLLSLAACAPEPAAPAVLPAVQAGPPATLLVSRLYHTAAAQLRVTGVAPGSTVRVYVSSTGLGSGPCFSGACLDIRLVAPLADAVADAAGVASLSWTVPAAGAPQIWLQAIQVGAPVVTNPIAARVYPVDHDTDREGLSDLDEFSLGTSIFKRDTDGDNASDFDELAMGTDPLDPDTDDDGVRDGREDVYGCDPFNPDTDGDGRLDGDDMDPTIPQAPDPFVVNEIFAADPDFTLPDPEFDEQLGRATWQVPEGGSLWVCDVNPSTGQFVPFSGRGALLDEGVAAMRYGKNGPEWAYGDGASTVIYTRRDNDVLSLWRADEIGGSWQISKFPDSDGQASPIGSIDPNDPNPRLRWIAQPGGVPIFGWRELNDPSTAITAPLTLKFTRHVPGSDLVVGTTPIGGVEQVHTWDPRTGVYEQLTTTGSDKGSVFFFNSPELGGEQMFFATVADTGGAPVQMGVFRNIGGAWQRIKLLTSPPGYPYVVSPEPMITPTGSYVVFLASKEPANDDNGEAVVWVASLAPGSDFARRVSAGTVQVRKDPEPYQGGARPWVYYTEVEPNGRRLVRRCETGL
jgi:hypothetical protein